MELNSSLNKKLQKIFLSPMPATRPFQIIYLNSFIIITFITLDKYLGKSSDIYIYILHVSLEYAVKEHKTSYVYVYKISPQL